MNYNLENVYHRYLNVPIDPNINLFDQSGFDTNSHHHIKFDKEEINPDLIKWLDNFSIKPFWYEAFYTPPNGGKLPIHIDGFEGPDYIKINWTYGAPGSSLIWWEPKSKEYIKTVETVFGIPYYAVDEENCNKVYEIEINKPSLVNAGLFHSTYNPTPEGRWTFSIPLIDAVDRNRLSWNDAIKRFEGLII